MGTRTDRSNEHAIDGNKLAEDAGGADARHAETHGLLRETDGGLHPTK